MKKIFDGLYHAVCWLIIFPVLLLISLCARVFRFVQSQKRPRLIWAGAPMPSLAVASQALSVSGYDSLSVVNQVTSNNYPGQFDIMLPLQYRTVKGLNTPLYLMRCITVFSYSLFTRDVLHSFFNGGILGHTPLLRVEALLWKLSGGKLILFAYGQDGFIYNELPELPWAQALKKTYPRSLKQDKAFKARIERLSKKADCIVGCLVHSVTLPRVDVWPVLWYPAPNIAKDFAGEYTNSPTLKIAHATNHRAIKGTDALIAAVKMLKSQGLDISLDIIEGVDIKMSRRRMARADIIVDQLLMGYAMSALEGLALGKIVISGFDKSKLYEPFFKNSYLNECPIISANPHNIAAVLEHLYLHPAERQNIKIQSAKYMRRWHSDKACSELFEAVYASIYQAGPMDLSTFYER